jgi:hypothetical protein
MKKMRHNIEKGIPIPDNIRKYGLVLYPFRTMKIGDSFLILCTHDKYKQTQDKMARAAQALRRRNKEKMFFISRFIKKERGLRVWRIK